jgi:hypothetical protein
MMLKKHNDASVMNMWVVEDKDEPVRMLLAVIGSSLMSFKFSLKN